MSLPHEMAITRLKVGAPEDLTQEEIDALLDYIDKLQNSFWEDRYDDLFCSITSSSPN